MNNYEKKIFSVSDYIEAFIQFVSEMIKTSKLQEPIEFGAIDGKQ